MCSTKSSNSVGVRLGFGVQVVVQLRGRDQFPDLRAQHRQLVRVERLHGRVLVQQLFQFGQVAVGVGAGHRRDQVVDDDRVAAPLGLGALAGVVDDERVDQREVAEHGVRRESCGQAESLAGQPFQRAVLAEVDHRVRAELAASQRYAARYWWLGGRSGSW